MRILLLETNEIYLNDQDSHLSIKLMCTMRLRRILEQFNCGN